MDEVVEYCYAATETFSVMYAFIKLDKFLSRRHSIPRSFAFLKAFISAWLGSLASLHTAMK